MCSNDDDNDDDIRDVNLKLIETDKKSEKKC